MEFVKQGTGLTLTMGFLAALASALARPSCSRIILAVGLLGLTLLAHKLAFAVALLIALPALAFEAKRRGQQLHAALLVFAGLIAFLFAGALVFAPERVLGVEGLLLLAHIFRGEADWSFATLAPGKGPHLFFRHEVLLAALAAILLSLAQLLFRRPTGSKAAAQYGLPPVALGIVFLSLLLAVPWLNVEDRQGLAMRLRLTAFLCLAPCSALLVSRLMTIAPSAVRATVAAGTIAALLLLLPRYSREGTVLVGPERAQAARTLEGAIPPDALVITTDRHLAFMTTWYTRASSRKTVPADLQPERTYRLITSIALEPTLKGALDACRTKLQPCDFHPLFFNKMILLTETGFQELVNTLPPESQRYWREWPTM
jgi:hypothetical protein